MSMQMDSATAPTGRFQHTLAADQDSSQAPVPTQLAHAAAVLSVKGVGLLIHEPPDRWIPLAASNQTAALVACLERAADDGPCQEAVRTERPVIATQKLLTRQ